jgi:exodeoxyribonuclease VII small subunit
MELSFEEALNKLESIVAQLESGDLPLEKSLALFEQGIALSRACREMLQSAERKVEQLERDANGNLTVTEIDISTLRS